MIKTESLTPQVLNIVRHKGTERPFAGEYTDLNILGTYLCRQCGLALFRSSSKFHSACGWPSFDEEMKGSVTQQIDADGKRTEILCSRCAAHLGHVFEGENFTAKNIRHCVNSLSLDFVSALDVKDTEEAILAAGCFWGVEHYFKQLEGVIKTEVGYIGGLKKEPRYQEVCQKDTGHFEAIRVVYDISKINYEKILKYFFEIHDFTQKNGQGPDIGPQYLSAVFYYNQAQADTAKNIISQLSQMNYSVATQLRPVQTFWPAENYHQNYYAKNSQQPYCHHHIKIFKE